jgi:hypothetical protein
MSKHSHVLIIAIALVFFIQGALFVLATFDSFGAGFRGWAGFSFFIALVHLFIGYSLIKRKIFAPHLGIFFQAYLVAHFIIMNRDMLYSPILFPLAISVLSISALLTTSLFLLRNKFIN